MDEVKTILNQFPGEWPDMVHVCLYTGGQRLGDIATMKWEQINMDGGLISMRTEKTRRRMNKPLIAPLKKSWNGEWKEESTNLSSRWLP